MKMARLISEHYTPNLLEQGSGDPLIYLHGFVDVHALEPEFMVFHKRLSQNYKIIAPELPEFASLSAADDPSAPDPGLVSHYLETLGKICPAHFELVGHGMGGWIAAEFAAQYPERVKSLILIDAMGLSIPENPLSNLSMMEQPYDDQPNRPLRELLFDHPNNLVAREWVPDDKADKVDLLQQSAILHFGRPITSPAPCFDRQGLLGRLSRITAPTLVIWGQNDRLVPGSHGATYAERIPNSVGMTLIDGAGHSAIAEQPDAVAACIERFLNNRRGAGRNLSSVSGAH